MNPQAGPNAREQAVANRYATAVQTVDAPQSSLEQKLRAIDAAIKALAAADRQPSTNDFSAKLAGAEQKSVANANGREGDESREFESESRRTSLSDVGDVPGGGQMTGQTYEDIEQGRGQDTATPFLTTTEARSAGSGKRWLGYKMPPVDDQNGYLREGDRRRDDPCDEECQAKRKENDIKVAQVRATRCSVFLRGRNNGVSCHVCAWCVHTGMRHVYRRMHACCVCTYAPTPTPTPLQMMGSQP